MWKVTVFAASSTVYVPKKAKLPCTMALFSSGVPDDYRNAAVSLKDLLALWIGTIKIGLLSVLLKRHRNQLPSSHVLGG
jgi:hypothetical protein